MSDKLMSLGDVIGQSNIVKWFASCIERDSLPQVLMLQGPPGIGKTSIAKIVACEIAYMNSPEKLDNGKQTVIQESKSTDCVRLYNMSNLRSQEAVMEVKSDLTIGFSSTGRKFIIMDEAHGMSDEAQDSLLTSFESLQANVYIIICSTELDSFRDAFLSRCILRRLRNLSQTEMRSFLKKRIEDNGLKFELSLPMVYTLVSSYTGREPRRAINLLDSFEHGSTVTVTDLETFFNVYEGKQLVTLCGYLYSGDILHGLEFIADMDFGVTFQSTLLEILRVAQNGQSTLLTSDAVLHLRGLVENNGINNLLGFAIDCTTKGRLTRNSVSGYFLKWCKKADEIFVKPTKTIADKVLLEDMTIMNTMLEDREIHTNSATDRDVQAKTLEMLFAEGETLEE